MYHDRLKFLASFLIMCHMIVSDVHACVMEEVRQLLLYSRTSSLMLRTWLPSDLVSYHG